MLDRDFGLVGTVEAIAGRPEEVKVLVRGAALGSVKDFVQTGDVFAIAAIRKTNRPAPPPARTATGKNIAPPPGSVPPPGFTATPRDFTLLRVIDVAADGSCRCAVLTKFQTAMPLGGGIVGYRAMKLGTVPHPVAVRLMNSDGMVYKSASAVSVRASDTNFVVGPATDASDVCDFHAGTAQFRTQRPLANVACITITLGSEAKLLPIPILSDAPITIEFNIDPLKEKQAAFERSVLAAVIVADDARLAQAECFAAVGKLIDKQKNAEALARAKGGFEAANATDKGLSDELVRLKEEAMTVQKSPSVDGILLKMSRISLRCAFTTSNSRRTSSRLMKSLSVSRTRRSRQKMWKHNGLIPISRSC